MRLSISSFMVLSLSVVLALPAPAFAEAQRRYQIEGAAESGVSDGGTFGSTSTVAPEGITPMPTSDGTLKGADLTNPDSWADQIPPSSPASGNPESGKSPTASSFDLESMSCEDKCSIVHNGLNQELLNPVCGQDSGCLSCIMANISQTQVGRYCTALHAYGRAKGPQTRAAALYGMVFGICLTACISQATPFGIPLQTACKVGNGVALANEILGMGQASSIDKELAGWSTKAEPLISKAAGATSMAASMGMAPKALKGLTQKVMGAKAKGDANSCVAAPFALIATLMKGASLAGMASDSKKLCGQVDQMTSGLKNTVNQCRTQYPGAGNIAATGGGVYAKPKPFTSGAITVDEETLAAMGDGKIADIFKQNKDQFLKEFDLLPQGFKDRVMNGENALDALSAEGLIGADLKASLKELEEKAKTEKTAFLSDGGGAEAMIAGGSGLGGKGAGSADDLSFGSRNVAAVTAAGAGVSEQGFGTSGSGSAEEYGAGCGTGVLHEGCDESIFKLVSKQLSRKSKHKAVAELKPALKLNQMLAGLKVEEQTDAKPGKPGKSESATKRAPANKVK